MSWYFNGSTLLNDTTNTSADITLDNGLVIRTLVLTINNISKELEGDYSCRGNNGVDNIIGTREHDTVFIFVQGTISILLAIIDNVFVISCSNIDFS